MKIIDKTTGETIAEVLTNHSMTLEEAIDLAGGEWVEDENEGDHYLLAGGEYWYDDLYIEC